MLGKIEGRRRRRRQWVIWLDSMDMMDMMVIWLESTVDMTVSKLQEIVKDRKSDVLQFMGSQRIRYDLVTEQQNVFPQFHFGPGFVHSSDWACESVACKELLKEARYY